MTAATEAAATTTIMINSNPCQSSYYCSASSLLEIVSNTTESLKCLPMTNEASYAWNSFFYECGTRQPNKNFLNNKTVSICNSDSDCLLVDKNITSCQCGADGKKYCIPAWDSVAFDDYWNDCENGLTHDQLEYWTLYKEYYAIWQTMNDLNCVSSTIYELSLMSQLSQTSFASCFFIGVSVFIEIF